MFRGNNKKFRRHPNQDDSEILSAKCHAVIEKIQNDAKLNNEDITNQIFTPNEIPDLDWPLLIGKNGEPILLYEKNPLGKGGFSIVYLGVHVDTGDLKAVKIQTIQSEEARQEIYREQNALHLLGALTDTLEINKDNNTTIYSIQELKWGKSLFDFLQELKSAGKSLSLKYEVDMCLSIVEALDELHIKGLLHRDIKTDQILWDSECVHASITDFGFAIKVEEASDLKEVVGSYMAVPPELWEKVTRIENGHLYTEGGFNQSEKTEIYGMGTILADVLIDQPPRDIYIKYYDEFDPLIKNASSPMICYEVYRRCYQDFFGKVDSDPIRNALFKIAIRMLDPDPDSRPIFAEAIKSLNICQSEILLREQHSNPKDYQLSEAFLDCFNQQQRSAALTRSKIK